MEGDDDFGVPAGWYPDPLGLPQLRWWDGQSWTEFTSEAQAPVMSEPVLAVPEPAMAATRSAEAARAEDAPSVAAPAATPFVEPVPAEPVVAAAIVTEPAVNVHNLGEQIQFLTRRERREYERRLEAEAALFPHAVDPAQAAGPAPYIQQPVVPEAAQSAGGFVAEPFLVEPLVADGFRPEPMPAFAEEVPRPQTPFADLLVGEPAPVLPAEDGSVVVPVEPPPFVAPGLRELEPGLSALLADAALEPSPSLSPLPDAFDSGFRIDETIVEDAPAPERTVMAKRSYTVAAWILAAFSVIQVALAYLVVVVLAQPDNRALLAVIWFGGLLVAAGVAGYDRLLLKAAGHERTASGWWALLTPLAYLLARWTRTRVETGRGALLVIVWIVLTAAAAGLVVLQPALFLAAIQ